MPIAITAFSNRLISSSFTVALTAVLRLLVVTAQQIRDGPDKGGEVLIGHAFL